MNGAIQVSLVGISFFLVEKVLQAEKQKDIILKHSSVQPQYEKKKISKLSSYVSA